LLHEQKHGEQHGAADAKSQTWTRARRHLAVLGHRRAHNKRGNGKRGLSAERTGRPTDCARYRPAPAAPPLYRKTYRNRASAGRPASTRSQHELTRRVRPRVHSAGHGIGVCTGHPRRWP
jgi:hypothetical protein